jgi:hypothetical protein
LYTFYAWVKGVAKLRQISEKRTRKEIIDPQLEKAGWYLRDHTNFPFMQKEQFAAIVRQVKSLRRRQAGSARQEDGLSLSLLHEASNGEPAPPVLRILQGRFLEWLLPIAQTFGTLLSRSRAAS